ncbi:hypothetical protein [Pseudochrobactrum sp. B5]|uniref:hypothetical protein n=1 Tax=Pseudochrobactrum sp. B5 TaxID=1289478 RepID=UPI0009527AAB|nr:hypothetical protein [Pseudochrobactrum sp. B5]
MRFIRNWIIPLTSTAFFAFLGFMLLGLPGVSIVQTLDGKPMPDGIPPEQITAIIKEGKRVGSYIDFYGFQLVGEPLYWTVGIIAVMAYIGYRLGAKARKVDQPAAQ